MQDSLVESTADSVQVPFSSSAEILTPMREAIRSKIEMTQETVLSDLKHAVGKYQHLGLSEVSGNMISMSLFVMSLKLITHWYLCHHL